jgi:hypothetical protein
MYSFWLMTVLQGVLLQSGCWKDCSTFSIPRVTTSFSYAHPVHVMCVLSGLCSAAPHVAPVTPAATVSPCVAENTHIFMRGLWRAPSSPGSSPVAIDMFIE